MRRTSRTRERKQQPEHMQTFSAHPANISQPATDFVAREIEDLRREFLCRFRCGLSRQWKPAKRTTKDWTVVSKGLSRLSLVLPSRLCDLMASEEPC